MCPEQRPILWPRKSAPRTRRGCSRSSMGDLSEIRAVLSKAASAQEQLLLYWTGHRHEKQLLKSKLCLQLVLQGLAPPDHFRLRAIHQHFGGAAARVVVRAQHRAVGAYVENGQQIALADQWKFSVTREKVARLADGADHVGDLGCARLADRRPARCLDQGNNLVIRTVQRRTQ